MLSHKFSKKTEDCRVRKNTLICRFVLVLLFTVAIPCKYGCKAYTTPATSTIPAPPHDTATTDAPVSPPAEEKEICMLPEDHDGYTPEMCAMCHKLAGLSETHEGIQGDDCMECHRFAE